MIKKIICPTDFSPEATNAITYASRIAQVFKAELLLLNVHQVPLAYAVSMGESIGNENTEQAAYTLGKICNNITGTIGIKAAYDVEYTIGSLANHITASADGETLIVMGTAGLHKAGDVLLGTHTYNVIKKAKCPVLLVPIKAVYKSLNNVVYALGYEEKTILALEPFNEFVKPFNPHITFLHISEHNTILSRESFKAEMDEIEDTYKNNRDSIDFKRRYSYAIRTEIENFAEENSADLLVIAVRRRNIFESLFKGKSVISGLSEAPKIPILVFHD